MFLILFVFILFLIIVFEYTNSFFDVLVVVIVISILTIVFTGWSLDELVDNFVKFLKPITDLLNKF